MKSIAELAAIKEKMKDQVAIRQGLGAVRVVVGMGTCGIAAGARPVLRAFVEEVNRAGLTGQVMVTQSGCIGNCAEEPVVEVMAEGCDKVTYGKMTPEKAARVVAEHLKGGKIVEEYTIGNK